MPVKQISSLILLLVCLSNDAQNGIFDWVKTYPAYQGWCSPNSVVTDPSGNVYTTGNFRGTIDFDPGPGVFTLATTGSNGSDEDIYISKFDQAGNFLWAIQLGDQFIDLGKFVTCDASGNIYVTGVFTGWVDFDPGPGVLTLSSQAKNIFVLKLNSSGNFVWAKSFVSILDQEIRSISVDGAGNVITTGLFKVVTDFDPGPGTYTMVPPYGNGSAVTTIFITKLDASGNFVWARQIGEDFTNQESMAVFADASGNVYTSGFFMGVVDFDPGVAVNTFTSIGFDGFLNKLDANGNFVYTRQLGGQFTEKAKTMSIDLNGDIIISGWFDGTGSDFDPGTGTYTLSAGGNQQDVFICKLSASGNFIWAKQIGGFPSYEDVASLVTDPGGNVYTTGVFFGNAATDFDPGAGVYQLSSIAQDAFISKLDINGNFLWAKQICGASSQLEPHGIACDNSGNIFTCGTFLGNVDFDPDVTDTSWVSTLYYEGYVHKLNACSITQTLSNITSANLNICPKNSTTLNVSGTGTINWMNGSLASSVIATGNSLVTPTLSTGIYWYYAQLLSPCPMLPLVVSVTVNPLPVISISNTAVCDAEMLILLASGATSYTWSNGSSQNTTAAVLPISGTSYSVTGADQIGCTNTKSINIISNLCVGISENISHIEHINAYPNPTNGVLNIEGADIVNTLCLVYDSFGREIKRDIISEGKIDLSAFAKGIYLLHFDTGERHFKIKVLKE